MIDPEAVSTASEAVLRRLLADAIGLRDQAAEHGLTDEAEEANNYAIAIDDELKRRVRAEAALARDVNSSFGVRLVAVECPDGQVRWF